MNLEFLERMNQIVLKKSNMLDLELQSNCCGARAWFETDICSDCKEHADFEIVE